MTEIIVVELTAEQIAEREAWDSGSHERALEMVRQQRQNSYQQLADPLFFKFQAGEATKEDWLAAREGVVAAHPYPEEEARAVIGL